MQQKRMNNPKIHTKKLLIINSKTVNIHNSFMSCHYSNVSLFSHFCVMSNTNIEFQTNIKFVFMQISLIIMERTRMTLRVYSHAMFNVLSFDIFMYVTHLVSRKVSINVLLYHVIYLMLFLNFSLTGIDDSLVCSCLKMFNYLRITTSHIHQNRTIQSH